MDPWSPPKELQLPPPRRCQMKSNFKGIIIFIAILFSLPSVMGAMIVYDQAAEAATLKAEGFSTEATIAAKNISKSKNSYVYSLSYRFDAPSRDGKQTSFQKSKYISEKEFMSLNIGDKVPILYNKTNPNQSAVNINDHIHKQNPWNILFIMLPLVLSCTYGLLFLITMPLYLKNKKLVEWGTPAEATIIAEEERNIGKTRCTVATYEFIDHNGKTIQGKNKYLPTIADVKYGRNTDNLRQVTNCLTVLYDPKNSKKSMLYPSSFVECLPPEDILKL